MKKLFAIIVSIFTIQGHAQKDLIFEKRFVQSEDKWVAFKADSTGAYPFGFIYIDEHAGLTLDYSGTFKIDQSGNYKIVKIDQKRSMKYRLEPNNVLVAHIPDDRISQLNLEKVPYWLKHYKVGEGTVERLYKWGYMYNGWNECAEALKFLEQAEKANKNYPGLQVELAYSFNCLKRYQDAVSHLKLALKDNPNDSYVNKEMIYAQTKIGEVKNAELTYKHVLKNCRDQKYNSENAYNILQAYYMTKDTKNFNRWLKEAGASLTEDQRFQPLVSKMKSDLKL